MGCETVGVMKDGGESVATGIDYDVEVVELVATVASTAATVYATVSLTLPVDKGLYGVSALLAVPLSSNRNLFKLKRFADRLAKLGSFVVSALPINVIPNTKSISAAQRIMN